MEMMMGKEEAAARAIYDALPHNKPYSLLTKIQLDGLERQARAAIAAAEKWDAAERARTCKHPRAQGVGSTGPNAMISWSCPDCGASYDSRKASAPTA